MYQSLSRLTTRRASRPKNQFFTLKTITTHSPGNDPIPSSLTTFRFKNLLNHHARSLFSQQFRQKQQQSSIRSFSSSHRHHQTLRTQQQSLLHHPNQQPVCHPLYQSFRPYHKTHNYLYSGLLRGLALFGFGTSSENIQSLQTKDDITKIINIEQDNIKLKSLELPTLVIQSKLGSTTAIRTSTSCIDAHVYPSALNELVLLRRVKQEIARKALLKQQNSDTTSKNLDSAQNSTNKEVDLTLGGLSESIPNTNQEGNTTLENNPLLSPSTPDPSQTTLESTTNYQNESNNIDFITTDQEFDELVMDSTTILIQKMKKIYHFYYPYSLSSIPARISSHLAFLGCFWGLVFSPTLITVIGPLVDDAYTVIEAQWARWKFNIASYLTQKIPSLSSHLSLSPPPQTLVRNEVRYATMMRYVADWPSFKSTPIYAVGIFFLGLAYVDVFAALTFYFLEKSYNRSDDLVFARNWSLERATKVFLLVDYDDSCVVQGESVKQGLEVGSLPVVTTETLSPSTTNANLNKSTTIKPPKLLVNPITVDDYITLQATSDVQSWIEGWYQYVLNYRSF